MQLVEGETVYVDVQLPMINSQQKRYRLVVSPLRENRLHVTSQRHVTGDVIGQLVVVRADSLAPICALNFSLPAAVERDAAEKTGAPAVDEAEIERVMRRRREDDGRTVSEGRAVTLRLTDVADMVHDDWQVLAAQLDVNDADVDDIRTEYNYPSEQVNPGLGEIPTASPSSGAPNRCGIG